MNTKTAAPVLITVSLVVLLSGCAGAAATQGASVRDDLSPAANAQLGIARGHVIVRDDLSPIKADALRELKGSVPQAQRTTSAPFSADAMRELKGSVPVPVDDDLSPLGGPR